MTSPPPPPADDRVVVVRNAFGQFSTWPATRAVPVGWSVLGAATARATALTSIDRLWTDLRPVAP